jgi:hypothetical protein
MGVLSDLRYLLSFGTVYESPVKVKKVFGTDITNIPKTPSTPIIVKPIDTRIYYTVCDNEYHIYYYPSYIKGTGSIMNTPGLTNTTESSNYEGRQHPVCKIKGKNEKYYRDFIITEDFVKYKGNDIVINKNYKCKGLGRDPGISQDLEGCDRLLLLGMLVVNFHSLDERLKHYISMLENGETIDRGHIYAPHLTISKIEKLTKILGDECVYTFLYRQIPVFGKIKIIYEKIKEYTDSPNPEFLKYILDLYNIVLPGGKFSSIKKYTPTETLKPKKLF